MRMEAGELAGRQFLRLGSVEASAQGAAVASGGDDIGEQPRGFVREDRCLDRDRRRRGRAHAQLPRANAEEQRGACRGGLRVLRGSVGPLLAGTPVVAHTPGAPSSTVPGTQVDAVER